MLCSGCRKFIDLIQIPIIFNRITTLSDKYWRFYFFTCTTCIVYQYFKELAAFVLKAGAKVKALFLTTKLFRKFFLFFLFTHFSGSLCERERMYKRKNKYALLVYNPNILNYFFEVFLKESAKTLKDNDVVEHIFSTVEKGAWEWAKKQK